MGIQRSQEDSWTKEMQKWEHRPVLVNGTYIEPIPMDLGGKLNAPHQEYPKMIYKAEEADGGPRLSAQILVHSELEEQNQCSRGWSVTPQAAIDQIGINQREFAKLAANRAYQERLMSPHARAEAAIVDEATIQHVPVIPEKPRTKRGRKPKSVSLG